MRLLWTDTLAALLVEHDRVLPEQVEAWVRRPCAYRLDDGSDPLELARTLLRERSSGGHRRVGDVPESMATGA